MSPDPGFGLYLHWPFCQSKCPYCDFNSHVAASIDQAKWQDAYLSEIARLGAETQDRILQTVYFGGGTPSLMDPELVGAILGKIRSVWRMSNDVEITLEANPTSVEASRFAGYRDAGVNRVSIGVQALNDDALPRLGRMHTVKEALRAVEIGMSVFPRVNFDLIYARQDQDLRQWSDELALALTLGSSHLSLYQLTVEDGTVFQQRHARGLLNGLPDDDLAADMFKLTQDLTADAGIPAYEVSNHAGPEQESRHNLIYWRGGDYVGVGPGAHGRLRAAGQRTTTEGIKNPTAWLDAVRTVGSGDLPRTILTPQEAGAEYMMMGLRLRSGLSLSRYSDLSGQSVDGAKLTHLQSLGLILIEDDILRTTETGTLVLNAILRDLLAG